MKNKKIYTLLYEGGLGGDFILYMLLSSSTLKSKNKYGVGYWPKINKWHCEDVYCKMFHLKYISEELQRYLNLQTTIIAKLSSNEIDILMLFAEKNWYYEDRKGHGPLLYDFKDVALMKEVDNFPEVTINEPFYTKGHHWFNYLDEKHTIKKVRLKWNASEKPFLSNLYFQKQQVDDWYTSKENPQQDLLEIENHKHIEKWAETHKMFRDCWTNDKFKINNNTLTIDSYYLIAELDKKQWKILADFFELNIQNIDWSIIQQYIEKNRKLNHRIVQPQSAYKEIVFGKTKCYDKLYLR